MRPATVNGTMLGTANRQDTASMSTVCDYSRVPMRTFVKRQSDVLYKFCLCDPSPYGL